MVRRTKSWLTQGKVTRGRRISLPLPSSSNIGTHMDNLRDLRGSPTRVSWVPIGVGALGGVALVARSLLRADTVSSPSVGAVIQALFYFGGIGGVLGLGVGMVMRSRRRPPPSGPQ
jgi:hypothetical protein